MSEILDRDQIDGAILLGRAIGHEAGLTAFGLPASTAGYAPIVAATGMTPAQRIVVIKAARTAQTAPEPPAPSPRAQAVEAARQMWNIAFGKDPF